MTIPLYCSPLRLALTIMGGGAVLASSFVSAQQTEPGAPAAAEYPSTAPAASDQRDKALRAAVSAMIPTDRHYRDLAITLIAELYEERNFLPLWNRSDGFYRDITDGMARHALPETRALDPVALLPQTVGTAVAPEDLAQTTSFLDAALLLRMGAMPTDSIWPDWNEGDRPGQGDASLGDLKKTFLLALSLEPMDFARAFDTFAPKNWIYRELLKAYPASKEAILQYSGLPNIPDPATAGVGRPGEVYPYAGAIASHLVDKGYLQMPPALAASLTTMTQELTIALSAFQRDYGLEPDGIFGPGSWS